jgi:glycosyltransferase involved in cell wall biosynthesis
MHILFVTGEYPPRSGGVGAYTAELGQALVQLGVRVSVLTSIANGTPATAAESLPVEVHRTVRRWGGSIWSEAPRLARKIGANWLHVQYQTAAFNMNPAINQAPSLWARSLPVAWTYHDLLVPYLFPKAGHWLRTWVTERPLSSAREIVATNERDRQRLAALRTDVHLIPIGSNIKGRTLSDDERTAYRRRQGYASRDLVVGYFGFLNRSKGGLTLIRSLDHLVKSGVNARLLLIGDQLGDSDPSNIAYRAEMEELIGSLSLMDRVRWTGRLADEEVAAQLNAVDVLVLPYEDGASTRRGTLMAGLTNGCAIVTTTPTIALPELVDGRDLIYVPASDAVATAAAVSRLAENPVLAASLRRSARACSAQFSWSGIAARHLELYSRS